MARGATIYRANLELSDVDRGVYAEATLTLARHPSETLERTLVRLLAFALCYEPDLEFGRGVSATDEPDLWSREGDGRVRRWIEVGQPDGKRLVFGNFFCSDVPATTPVIVDDGGDCYFNVFFDPTTGAFSKLIINGDA